jgi:hypothetical protein
MTLNLVLIGVAVALDPLPVPDRLRPVTIANAPLAARPAATPLGSARLPVPAF